MATCMCGDLVFGASTAPPAGRPRRRGRGGRGGGAPAPTARRGLEPAAVAPQRTSARGSSAPRTSAAASWCSSAARRDRARPAGASSGARPARLQARFRRPVLAGAAAAAALSVAITVGHAARGASPRQRAIDVGLVTQSWGGWAGDVRRGGDRRGDRGRGRAARWCCDAPLRAPLVGAGRGARRRVRRRHHVRGPGRARPDLQQLRAAPAGELRRDVLALAGARGGRRRRGLRGGRVPPHDGRQRLRRRASAHQAGRALRHAARGLHARRGAPRRRPRARPRPLRRRAARAAVARDRRAVRHVRRGAAGRAPGAEGPASRPPSPPWRSRSRSWCRS